MATSTKHIALLRGINVGGKHKLPMKALAELFRSLGAADVQTYIQSGNVVFRADSKLAKSIPTLAAEAIEAEFGFAVPVITRSAKQWRRVVEANPYAGQTEDHKQLHVGLIDRKPSVKAAGSLDPARSPPDQFTLLGRELYLFCPKGVARTKLTCAYFDTKLDRVVTMRNWRTTNKLLELLESD